ncbi:hypothetical protein [Kribbella sp. NPDC003557]|uniref:hypothetical protein n=1 Tax=Kribbella sp. NPDC003557 TaxID=3154449 RepID=UPI0033A437AD
MSTRMFPIGQCLGTYYADAGGIHVQQVRLGWEIVELDDEEFAVWALAHGLADEGGPWNRARMVALLAGRRIQDSDVLIESLLSRRLLAEVDVDVPSDFAASHRLLPLHIGRGSSAEATTMFTAGTANQPFVGMTRTLYDVWLWCHLSPSLLAACTERDADVSAVLTALHPLLALSAACLDIAVPEGRA